MPFIGEGMASICTVVILGSVNALEVLSSSSTDPGEMLPGLLPILTWPMVTETNGTVINSIKIIFLMRIFFRVTCLDCSR